MPGLALIAVVPAALLTGGAVAAQRARLSWREGVGLRWPAAREAVTAVVVFAMLSVGTELLWRHWGLADTGPGWRAKYDGASLIPRVLLVALVYPVAEEFFFRGVVFGALLKRFGSAAALAGSSLFFAVLHVQYDLRGMALVLIDAVFFGAVRGRTGSVLLTMALHVAGNTYATWQRL